MNVAFLLFDFVAISLCPCYCLTFDFGPERGFHELSNAFFGLDVYFIQRNAG